MAEASCSSARLVMARKSEAVFARSASTLRTRSRSAAPLNTSSAPSSRSARSLPTYLQVSGIHVTACAAITSSLETSSTY